MLTKRGVSPYHMCYEVDDANREYDKLIQENLTAMFKLVVTPAFDNRKIYYFWDSEIGFIEIINCEK